MIRNDNFLKKSATKGKDPQDNKEEETPSHRHDSQPGELILYPAPVSIQAEHDPLEEQGTRRDEELTHEPAISEARISPVVMGRGRALDREESSGLYHGALQLAEEINNHSAGRDVLEDRPIVYCVNKLIEQMMLDNEHLFEMTADDTGNNRYGHPVNVCILTVKIGIGLGYDREQLMKIGVLAFLHDLGMAQCTDLVGPPRKLSRKEHRKINKHCPTIASQIREVKDVPDLAVHTAFREHERADSDGSANGKKNTYAQIIALADLYETVMHTLPQREKFTPFRTMREILGMKDFFEYRVMKAFVDVVGIFPVGSIVRLNTDEMGTVARINPGFPTRPVINITHDRDGNTLDEVKVLDLTKQPTVYISEGLREESEKRETHEMVTCDKALPRQEPGPHIKLLHKNKYSIKSTRMMVMEKRRKKRMYFYTPVVVSILFVLLPLFYEEHQDIRTVPEGQPPPPIITEERIPLPTFRNDLFDQLLTEAQINHSE